MRQLVNAGPGAKMKEKPLLTLIVNPPMGKTRTSRFTSGALKNSDWLSISDDSHRSFMLGLPALS
jgi:hypothetical protein